jgi:DNA-binding Lrp family transcriptional regulator
VADVISVFVFVNAEQPRDIARLGQAIADLDGVYECYSVTGDFDVVAILRLETHDDIARVVTERIAQLPGVASTRTNIAFKRFSTADQSI